MKYVPGLIPTDKKVLPDYFKDSAVKPPQTTGVAILLSIGAAILFVVSLFFLGHPLLAFLLWLIGLVLLPQGRRWLEVNLRFQLTPKITIIFTAAVAVAMIPLFIYYGGVDKREAAQHVIELQKQQADDVAAAKEKKRQDDSISVAAVAADSMRQAQEARAVALAKQGSYEKALPLLTNLISQGSTNSDLHYYRALCYFKAGLVQDAVDDLKPLLNSNNEAADKLYDRVNPLIKEVTGYITLCNDGSTSYARGRGACSHHGGVANWNQPVYSTSRKYE